jgi:cell division initiation protein
VARRPAALHRRNLGVRKGFEVDIYPLELREQQFRKTLRGYDPEEVKGYLEGLAARLEKVLTERAELQARLDELQKKVESYRDIEVGLRDTLMEARKIREEAIGGARKEAELTLREAEVEARKVVARAEERLERLQSHLNELTSRKRRFLAQYKELLHRELRLLEFHEQEDEGSPGEGADLVPPGEGVPESEDGQGDAPGEEREAGGEPEGEAGEGGGEREPAQAPGEGARSGGRGRRRQARRS